MSATSSLCSSYTPSPVPQQQPQAPRGQVRVLRREECKVSFAAQNVLHGDDDLGSDEDFNEARLVIHPRAKNLHSRAPSPKVDGEDSDFDDTARVKTALSKTPPSEPLQQQSKEKNKAQEEDTTSSEYEAHMCAQVTHTTISGRPTPPIPIPPRTPRAATSPVRFSSRLPTGFARYHWNQSPLSKFKELEENISFTLIGDGNPSSEQTDSSEE